MPECCSELSPGSAPEVTETFRPFRTWVFPVCAYLPLLAIPPSLENKPEDLGWKEAEKSDLNFWLEAGTRHSPPLTLKNYLISLNYGVSSSKIGILTSTWRQNEFVKVKRLHSTWHVESYGRCIFWHLQPIKTVPRMPVLVLYCPPDISVIFRHRLCCLPPDLSHLSETSCVDLLHQSSTEWPPCSHMSWSHQSEP